LKDLRENHSKASEDRDLNSLQAHRWYKSLPNKVLQSTSAGKAPQIGWSYTTDSMIHVFSDLRENCLIAVESNDLKSFQVHRRFKSIRPNMAFQTSSIYDASEAMLYIGFCGPIILSFLYFRVKLYTYVRITQSSRSTEFPSTYIIPDNILLAQSQVDSVGMTIN